MNDTDYKIRLFPWQTQRPLSPQVEGSGVKEANSRMFHQPAMSLNISLGPRHGPPWALLWRPIALLFDEKILVILALDPYTYVLLFGVINQGHRNNHEGLGS